MNEIVGYSFPVLSNEFLHYNMEDNNYTFSFVDKDENNHPQKINYRFQHKLAGTNLVSKLIKDGKARFGCIVSLPSTLYRETFLCSDIASESSDLINKYQEIKISRSFHSLESPRILPVVVYYDGNDFDSSKELDDYREVNLHKFWEGKTFVLSKGDIIARDSWHYFKTHVVSIIKFKLEESLDEGAIGDVTITEKDGGKFIVDISADLFQALKCERDSPHGKSITTHILAKCLRELKSKYKQETDYNECINIKSLMTQLIASSKKIDMEDDEEASFDEDKAACVLLPHRLPQNEFEE